MSRQIFDYNKANYDPSTYTPQTSKKTTSVEEEFLGSPGRGVPGFEESSYDDSVKYLSDYYNPDRMRAANQGAFTKIGLAIPKGISKGALSFVEYAGYLLDAEEWLGADTDELDAAYSNWLSEAAIAGKEGIDNLAPIYRSSNQLFDTNDLAGSVAQGLDGLIDSSVAFGLLGFTVAAIGGAALGALLGTSFAAQALTRVGTAALTNYAESKQMAGELIKNVRTELDEKLSKGEITEEQYKQGLSDAAIEADKFIWRNKTNMWQDFLALRSLKGINPGTRALAKESTKLSNILKDTAGESFEEIYSGALQAEGEYQAKKSAKIDVSNYDDSVLGRALNYAASEQGIYEGVLGALGGPVQSYAVNKPIEKFITKTSYNDRVKRQQEQESFYAQNKSKILATAAKQKAIDDDLNDALSKGDTLKAKDLHAQTFADLAYNNFIMGTTEKLEESLDDLIKAKDTDPTFKEYLKQYKANLPALEESYKEIYTRRVKETKAKNYQDIAGVINQGLVAEEFKLNVLKQHALNQVGEINKALQSKINNFNTNSLLSTGAPFNPNYFELIKVKAEIAAVKADSKIENLPTEIKDKLDLKLKNLKERLNQLKPLVTEDIKSFPDLKAIEALTRDKVQYETSLIAYNNQIEKVQKNELTLEMARAIRNQMAAVARVTNSKNTVDTKKEDEELLNSELEKNPTLDDVEKEQVVLEADKARQDYINTIYNKVKEILDNPNLSNMSKVKDLKKLHSEVKDENNYPVDPTTNDSQATNLKNHIVNTYNKLEEEEAERLKAGVEVSSKITEDPNTPKSEEDKNALIKSGAIYGLYLNPSQQKNTFGEDYSLATTQELDDLLNNTSIEEINANIELIVRPFDNSKIKIQPTQTKVPKVYEVKKGVNRFEIAVVYKGKIIGFIYEPNRFFTLSATGVDPIIIDQLSDIQLRKLAPTGNLDNIRQAYKNASNLVKYLEQQNIKQGSVLKVNNKELQDSGFKLKPLFREFDQKNSIDEWVSLDSVTAGNITLPNGSKSYVIYDKQGLGGYISNNSNQTNKLIDSLPENKKIPSSKLGRYAMLVQLPNSTYEWVPVASNPYSDINSLFSEISEVFKTKDANNKLNYKTGSRIFDNLFIASKGGKYYIDLDFTEEALRLKVTDPKTEESFVVKVFTKEFAKIKSMEELVTLLNKKLTSKPQDAKAFHPNVAISLSNFRERVKLNPSNNSEASNITKQFVTGVSPNIFKQAAGTSNIGFNMNEVESIEPNIVLEVKIEEESEEMLGNIFGTETFEETLDVSKPVDVEPITFEVVLPVEAEERAAKELPEVDPILDKLKGDLEEAQKSGNKLKISRAKAKLESYLLNKSKNTGALKVSTNKAEKLINYKEAKNWLQKRLPSNISVESLDNLLYNLEVAGIPFGLFLNNVIYLNSQAESGTEFHEAFHSVFRTLLTDSEINSLLAQARKEFKKPSNEELIELRQQSQFNYTLSLNQLIDLYYEEKMADKFMDVMLGKSKSSWLQKLITDIKNWFNFVTNNQTDLEAFFYKLDKGHFKNSNVVNNRFNNLSNQNPVYKVLYKGANEDSDIDKVTSAELSNKIIYTTAAQVGNTTFPKEIYTLEDKVDYILDNLYNQLYNLENEEVFERYSQLLEGKSEKFQNDFVNKLTEYSIIYSNERNRAIIKDQVKELLKAFKTESTEEQDRENIAEEYSERFDVDFYTIGGFDSLTAPAKEFIGLTLYKDVDEFGNEIESGVDAVKVYNGITASLAGAEDNELLLRLKEFSKHNPQARAVYENFKKAVDLQDDGSFNQDKIDTYYNFLNAFKKEKVSFWTILRDPQTNNTLLVEANRKSSKQVQAANWAGAFNESYVKIQENKENSIPYLKALNEILKSFDELSDPVSEKRISELADILVSNLNKIGITISKGFAEYSLINYQAVSYPSVISNELLERHSAFSRSVNTDITVNPTHIQEFIKTLQRGENIYDKNDEELNKDKKGSGKFKGSYFRVLKISEGNTYFDENVIESTFTNAENKKVYSYLQRNYLVTEGRKLKDSSYRKALQESTFINNNNHLLNSEFSAEYFSNFNISLIDGIRNTEIAENQDVDTVSLNTKGTTFGKMEPNQYLLTALTLFGKQVKTPSFNKANFIFRQLEASNTGATANLPVFDYFKTTNDIKTLSVTSLFKEHLKGYITQEWDRIQRVQSEYESNPNRDIFSNYNDVKSEGGKDKLGRGFKFWIFPQLNSEGYDSKARNGMQLTEALKDEMLDVVLKQLELEYNDFLNLLETEGLYKKTDKQELSLLPADTVYGKSFIELLGQYFTNDFLNSIAINQLYDGDYAVGRKDFIDMVKRHKGSIGYGPDMGEGFTNIAIISDPEKFVSKDTLEDISYDDLENDDKQTILQNEISRILETNPSLNYDQAVKIASSSVFNIKVADAQSYVTIEHVILQLQKLGRYNKEVKNIYNKILKGETISLEDTRILERNRAALNSRKTIIFDGDVYYKMSEFPLAPALINRPGFEWHKNLLNSMNASGVDQALFASASKASTRNVVPFNSEGIFDFSNGVTPVENKYKRLQVETPSGKESITAGTQLINLIIAEQNNDLIVNYRGEDISIRQLKSIYYNLLTDVRDVSFLNAKQFLVDLNNNVNPKKAAKKFLESIEDSGGSELLIKYFSLGPDGKPLYNWNLTPIIEKAEELFLAHFNKEYSVQKIEGTKAYLVSDTGVKKSDGSKLKWGVKDPETGQVWSECMIPPFIAELFKLNPGDPIPREVSEMLGVRIPTQDKHSMITLRVAELLPAEYGSVIILPKQVVLLAGSDFDIDSLYISRYAVYVDSEERDEEGRLISQQLKRYGSAETIEDKFKEYVFYHTSKNKEVIKYRKEYILNNKAKLTEEAKNLGMTNIKKINRYINESADSMTPVFMRQAGLAYSLLSFKNWSNNGTIDINKASIDNKILDAQITLFSNSHIQDKIAKTPATIDALEEIAADVTKLRKEAGNDLDLNKYNGFSIMGKYVAFVNNNEGKDNIGPTALANVLNAELTAHNVEYTYKDILESAIEPNDSLVMSDSTKEYFDKREYLYLIIDNVLITGYGNDLDSSGNRKADNLSTVLSAMTDNAKNPLAALLNLGLEMIPVINQAITQGVSLRAAVLMANTPYAIQAAKAAKASIVKNSDIIDFQNWEAVLIGQAKAAGLNNINLNYTKKEHSITTERLEFLVKTKPENYLKDTKISNEDKIQFIKDHLLVLKSLDVFNNQQSFVRHISSIQALYRGMEVSFEDCERFIEAINATKIYKYFKNEDVANYYAPGKVLSRSGFSNVKGSSAFDLDLVFKNNPSLVALAEKASIILAQLSPKFFISRTTHFNDLSKSILISLQSNRDSRKAVSNQLLAFLTTSAFKTSILNNPNHRLYSKMLELGTDESFGGLFSNSEGLPSIGEELNSLKARYKQSGQNNYLVNMLLVKKDPITNFTTIEFSSMSKFSNLMNNKLADGFVELYSNDKELAEKLFLYLFFKDNFKFKYNSFINQIANFMFNDYSKIIDQIQKEFNKTTLPDANMFGYKSMESLFEDFKVKFFRDINNQIFLKRINNFEALSKNELVSKYIKRALTKEGYENIVDGKGLIELYTTLKSEKKKVPIYLSRLIDSVIFVDSDNTINYKSAFKDVSVFGKVSTLKGVTSTGAAVFVERDVLGLKGMLPYAFSINRLVKLKENLKNLTKNELKQEALIDLAINEDNSPIYSGQVKDVKPEAEVVPDRINTIVPQNDSGIIITSKMLEETDDDTLGDVFAGENFDTEITSKLDDAPLFDENGNPIC